MNTPITHEDENGHDSAARGMTSVTSDVSDDNRDMPEMVNVGVTASETAPPAK